MRERVAPRSDSLPDALNIPSVVNLSEVIMLNKFVEIPANKISTSNRKPVAGIGINDADYVVNKTINGKRITCPFYSVWQQMIVRCYSTKCQSKHPTYKGCTVCDEWKLFSNFKKWMKTQDWAEKEIDKDIVHPGNKIYSPENCVFVSANLNALLTSSDASRGDLPIGVNWHKWHGKFASRVSFNGLSKHLGYFNTAKEASNAYKKQKIKILMDESSKQSDPRVSNGLKLHAEMIILL